VPLADAGTVNNPLIGGVDHFFKVLIGQDG
jgi:hypothetical protein